MTTPAIVIRSVWMQLHRRLSMEMALTELLSLSKPFQSRQLVWSFGRWIESRRWAVSRPCPNGFGPLDRWEETPWWGDSLGTALLRWSDFDQWSMPSPGSRWDPKARFIEFIGSNIRPALGLPAETGQLEGSLGFWTFPKSSETYPQTKHTYRDTQKKPTNLHRIYMYSVDAAGRDASSTAFGSESRSIGSR